MVELAEPVIRTAGPIIIDPSVLTGVIDFITQSWLLTAGVVLLIAAVGLSALSGLLDIAVYIALAGGVLLVALGAVNWFAPGLVPLAFSPSPAGQMVRVQPSVFVDAFDIMTRIYGPIYPAWAF